jgi:hypothetical protein
MEFRNRLVIAFLVERFLAAKERHCATRLRGFEAHEMEFLMLLEE